MKRILTAAALVLFVSGPALAGQCPVMVKQIDAALASSPAISTEQIALAKKLRDSGEALHKAGKHKKSIETLAKSRKILGLQ